MPPPSETASQPDLFLGETSSAIDRLHASTAVYTSESVVDLLLDLLGWPDVDGPLLDPGAGDAVFAERAISRLNLDADDVDGVSRRVQAWEVHPAAAESARSRIARHLIRRGWATAAARSAGAACVVQADFLAPGPQQASFSAVAGNPPYLRFAALPDPLKLLYRRFVPAYARSDLLPAFLNRCTEVLCPEGRIACVTADRWLFNSSQAKLRERLGSRFGIESLTRLDASTSFYRPKRRRKGTPARIHPVAILLSPAARDTAPLTGEPVHPDASRSDPPRLRLRDVATVRLAPWLGSHGVFVLDRTEAAHLPPGALVPCVDTDDIRAGVVGEPRRVALRTRRGEDPGEAVLRHLANATPQLPRRARRDPFWLPPESWGPLPFAGPSLLVPRISRGLVAVRLPGGVLPINHNLSVAHHSGSLEELAAAITSPASQRWIRERAPRLENGYLSITTRLLRELPVEL